MSENNDNQKPRNPFQFGNLFGGGDGPADQDRLVQAFRQAMERGEVKVFRGKIGPDGQIEKAEKIFDNTSGPQGCGDPNCTACSLVNQAEFDATIPPEISGRIAADLSEKLARAQEEGGGYAGPTFDNYVSDSENGTLTVSATGEGAEDALIQIEQAIKEIFLGAFPGMKIEMNRYSSTTTKL